jgi:hypothetical protein
VKHLLLREESAVDIYLHAVKNQQRKRSKPLHMASTLQPHLTLHLTWTKAMNTNQPKFQVKLCEANH